MKNLIGISGKIGTGKDTVALMIRAIDFAKKHPDRVERFWKCDIESLILKMIRGDAGIGHADFEIKKYASKLKQIGGLILGVPPRSFEFREWKEAPLGGVWGDLTPRLLLQKLGTEGGRELIHENIWVNALFADLKEDSKWIITDVRFPNEADEIKRRGGYLIRVERDVADSGNHPSETALDDYEGFDEVIFNESGLLQLIEKVKMLEIW